VVSLNAAFFLTGDEYILRMRFVDHVYDDQVIDHAKVKIILPEGARYIKVSISVVYLCY